MKKSLKKRSNISSILFFLATFLAAFSLVLVFLRKKPLQKEKEEFFDLNDRQEKILNVLKEKGEVTIDDLRSEVGSVSERTLRRDMKRLEELGLSRKEGSTKGSKYIYEGV